MSFPRSHNIGASIAVVRGSANATLTAGGSGDNTQVVGAIIDRAAYNYPLSCVLAITVKAVLAASKKLTLKSVILEHDDTSNLASATTFAAPADVDVLVDSGSGSTMTGQKEYDIDLAGAKRYIRLSFTPDLNATGTDTAEAASVVVLGGVDTLPV